jgi:hypothetical protein
MNRRNQSVPDEVDPYAANPAGYAPIQPEETAASDTVTSQVSAATSLAIERGSELASTASRQLQTYAEDLAAFTRRRPIGALAGAVIVGMLIGLFGRRRS